MKTNTWLPKKMKLKPAVLLILVVLFGIELNAQNLVVTFTNSTTESFPISDIQSIKFGTSSMILNELNGSVTSWDIGHIDNYRFENTVGINNGTNTETIHLSVFPNPATRLVNIQFSSIMSTLISIDIVDAHGRIIQSIYQGKHQGKETYQWNSNVQNGTYYCRVITDNKTITKPVIIQ